jgi:hypothetical protein
MATGRSQHTQMNCVLLAVVPQLETVAVSGQSCAYCVLCAVAELCTFPAAFALQALQQLLYAPDVPDAAPRLQYIST